MLRISGRLRYASVARVLHKQQPQEDVVGYSRKEASMFGLNKWTAEELGSLIALSCRRPPATKRRWTNGKVVDVRWEHDDILSLELMTTVRRKMSRNCPKPGDHCAKSSAPKFRWSDDHAEDVPTRSVPSA